ncbi:unnamed protein product [Dibothriocephalus latus]|uniref:Uncharacterized protein n=1 Tax=Dibothriocephalus latus TaxID=60516 RepID=A0A3P6TBU2_DIBLA|nr:unnamed protein product [Dibothriocephalus latus]
MKGKAQNNIIVVPVITSFSYVQQEPGAHLKGLETAMDYINGGISAYFDEDLKSLLQTQMNQFLDELNQTAVSELYQGLNPKTYRQLAPQIIDQLGRPMDGWMAWTTEISRSGQQLLGALYGEWQRLGKATTGFVSFSADIIRNDLERISKEMRDGRLLTCCLIVTPTAVNINECFSEIEASCLGLQWKKVLKEEDSRSFGV